VQSLLVGEPADARDPAEIRHWLVVYTELISELKSIPPENRTRTLAQRMAELENRRRFWLARFADKRATTRSPANVPPG
jgi:hypothetical protein